jgi:hypothetical protein
MRRDTSMTRCMQRRAVTRFLAFLLGLGVIATAAPATADFAVLPLKTCSEVQPADPSLIFTTLSRDESVITPEVIVEGIIESYAPMKPARTGCENCVTLNSSALASIRVVTVWKGEAMPRAVLAFHGYDVCAIPALVGKPIRVGATLATKDFKDAQHPTPVTLLSISIDPFLLFDRDRRSGLVNVPLGDPDLDRRLDAYGATTSALQEAAASGDRKARLAFAEHLRVNNERHRAFEIYDALLRENPDDFDLLLILASAGGRESINDDPEITLEELELRVPKTEEWNGKIARTRFAETGRLTTSAKDWSNLKRTHDLCYSDHGAFDDAAFDHVDLARCAFRYSSFRNASFRGTDLSGSYFQNSDLAGAKYDCATKLPDDLDPVAAGMINVEGECHAP